MKQPDNREHNISKIEYVEVELDELVRYWTKGYEGYKPVNLGEWFWVDTSKNKVVIS